jgi:hypothetical protein
MQQHNGLGLQFYHRVNSAGRTGRRSTEMWTWPEKDREDHLPCDRPYLRCGGSAATLQGLAPLGFPASAVSTAQSSFCPLLTPRLHLNAFLLPSSPLLSRLIPFFHPLCENKLHRFIIVLSLGKHICLHRCNRIHSPPVESTCSLFLIR